MRTVCIDFETANSWRTSVCALGVAVIEDAEVVETREWLIRPRKGHGYFHPINIEIHGIQYFDVASAPEFDAVFAELAPLLDGALAVAHNTPFDMAVLRQLVELYEAPCPAFDYLCTCAASRKLWPGLPNHRLDTVCAHVGHSFDHHQAGADALAAGKLLLAMMAETNSGNPLELATRLGIGLGQIPASPNWNISHNINPHVAAQTDTLP